MTKPIIEIKGLGKKYKIGALREPYLSLRDSLARKAKGFAQSISRLTTNSSELRAHSSQEDFWALKDVNFSVQQGEAVGIIGRNGAGKSTLLKILSQITPPTEGEITCRGRIASLLEVGTGFHPELTGRENIYLNGAILGMTRGEIRSKFDEIVAFAEVEKFLDTPVKRYSSGMYVRLAFAVAAHLEPEILVVDEVLAVGDAQFQSKCLGKMSEVAKGGRTVLFVSHNMAAVSSLCAHGIVLKNGMISFAGGVLESIGEYTKQISTGVRIVKFSRSANEPVYLESISVRNADDTTNGTVFIGDKLNMRFVIHSATEVRSCQISFMIRQALGVNLLHCVGKDAIFAPTLKPGVNVINATFDNVLLYPGDYVIDGVWLADVTGQTIMLKRDCLRFQVAEGGERVLRKLDPSSAVVHIVPRWEQSVD